MLILIIEDDLHIRNNLVEILELEGYETLAVESGADGVKLAIEKHPDIIFCDLMMPVMNGYEVLEVIRDHAITKDTPFIFVTARTEREAVKKGMAMGATDFLLKPFTTDTILKMIESYNKK